MIMWLEDKDGKSPEEVLDNKGLATWLDGVISVNVPEETDAYNQKFLSNIEDDLRKELTDKVSSFQNHRHTFR